MARFGTVRPAGHHVGACIFYSYVMVNAEEMVAREVAYAEDNPDADMQTISAAVAHAVLVECLTVSTLGGCWVAACRAKTAGLQLPIQCAPQRYDTPAKLAQLAQNARDQFNQGLWPLPAKAP